MILITIIHIMLHMELKMKTAGKMRKFICFFFIFSVFLCSATINADQKWKYIAEEKIDLNNIDSLYLAMESVDLKPELPQSVRNSFKGSIWMIREIKPASAQQKNIQLKVSFYGALRVYYQGRLISSDGYTNDSTGSSNPVIIENKNIILPSGSDKLFVVVHYTDAGIDENTSFLRYNSVLDYFKLNIDEKDSESISLTPEFDDTVGNFIITALLSLAIAYLIFFFFNKRNSFLLFTLYLTGAVIYTFSIRFPYMFFFSGYDFSAKLSLTGVLAVSVTVLFLYQFIRSESFNKLIWIYIGSAAAAILLNIFYPEFQYSPLITVLIISGISIQASRQILIIYSRKSSGYRYIFGSGISFTVFWLLLVFNSLNNIFFGNGISSILTLQLVLLLINALAIAGYLAKVFSERSGYLEKQIEELKAQNEKAIQKEKDYKKKEIAQRLLEAETSRKENEVEEARQIQLSLIPHTFPELRNVDVDAYMKTSSEVGGNYYDFYLDENDKTLTFILGDSNGRGIKSVIMTAATKSLFLTNGNWEELNDLMKEFDGTLSKLGSGILTMSLTIGRLRGNLLEIISAGMPAVLVYRSKIADVEQIIFRTHPIGSVNESELETKQFVFNKEDVILIMTDGFPKLENPQGEKLNYSRIMEILKGVAAKPVKDIADELTNSIRVWSDSRVPNDDVSFIIFKFK